MHFRRDNRSRRRSCYAGFAGVIRQSTSTRPASGTRMYRRSGINPIGATAAARAKISHIIPDRRGPCSGHGRAARDGESSGVVEPPLREPGDGYGRDSQWGAGVTRPLANGPFCALVAGAWRDEAAVCSLWARSRPCVSGFAIPRSSRSARRENVAIVPGCGDDRASVGLRPTDRLPATSLSMNRNERGSDVKVL